MSATAANFYEAAERGDADAVEEIKQLLKTSAVTSAVNVNGKNSVRSSIQPLASLMGQLDIVWTHSFAYCL